VFITLQPTGGEYPHAINMNNAKYFEYMTGEWIKTYYLDGTVTEYKWIDGFETISNPYKGEVVAEEPALDAENGEVKPADNITPITPPQ